MATRSFGEIADGAALVEKQDILLMLHIPPPVHGSSVVGKLVLESNALNSEFVVRHLNLLASRNLGESGKWSFEKLTGFLDLVLRLFKLLNVRHPVLCYFALTTTGFAFFRDAFLCGILKSCRVPIVFHLHNKGVLKKSTSILYRVIYRYVFRGSHVILLSERLYPDVADFVPLSHVHFCPNGIEDLTERDRRPLTPAVSQYSTCVKLLFLSNLVISKGVFVLLDACAILKTRGLNFSCIFAGAEGDIDGQAFLERRRQLSLDGFVSFLGPQYDEAKYDLLGQADVFVLPTFHECFPLVLLEAMSFGLPVVSCPEGGIPDQVLEGVNGFLVDQHNAQELANRLEELIRNPELRLKMGQAGRRRFEESFTLEVFEDRFVKIIRRLASDAK